MLDLEADTLQDHERELLTHPATGGVILFTRNYRSPQQLYRLVEAIHECRGEPLLVAVDQEGGRVQRFREGFTRLPAAARIAAHCGPGEPARQAARELGWLMAAELRVNGVDFSFAPVLDIDYGVSEVIGDRAFAGEADEVLRLAAAWARGAGEAGMVSVGKHFPGHGGVEVDSHVGLPVDERSFERIRTDDLPPFAGMIDAGLEGIMPAHVVYAACDQRPAGFSRFWLQDVLRRQLGFEGVIFSDDLTMEAAGAAGDYAQRAHAAVDAGCDMVLVCNNQVGAREVLEAFGRVQEPALDRRLGRLRGRPAPAPDLATLQSDERWKAARSLAAEILDEPGVA